MIHVLIVDEDAVLRRQLASALAGGGFGVTTASDGSRARRLVEVAPPDIVLLGHHVAEGCELVRAIKRRYGASMYVAVLSEDASPDAREAGADAVLAAPVAISALRRRLTAAASALALRHAVS